jgi:hypothetical protein
MGKGSEGIPASDGDSENNELGSCKAHHVSGSPQEDRSISAGKVGENKGAAKEGCLVGLFRIPAPTGHCHSFRFVDWTGVYRGWLTSTCERGHLPLASPA